MTEFDPIAYINEPRWRQVKPGLERIDALLDELGRPQDDMRFVHVAGTNGKGSTCAYVSNILRCAGYKTGLFTSPYIVCFEERIQVDGETIHASDLLSATLLVKEAAACVEARLGEHPTEFELMCAVALVHFKKMKCDICVMECGLGGRLDATNVVLPDVCVIARIGFDHTDLLGDTLDEIAAEKAGIIKAGARVVSWPHENSAFNVIEDVCENKSCPLTHPDFSALKIGEIDLNAGRRCFSYKGQNYSTRLLGSYQPQNASLAIEAVYALQRCGWDISVRAIQQGIASTEWPGRFQLLGSAPLRIIDAAHNPQGASALVKSLTQLFRVAGKPDMKVCFVMGVLADKNYEEIIAQVVPLASSFDVYAPDNPRALSAEDLKQAVLRQVPENIAVFAHENARTAAESALCRCSQDGCIVAFGSMYSIAELTYCLGVKTP